MPVVHVALEEHEVLHELLVVRKYGRHLQAGFALVLTVADPTQRRESGMPVRKILAGISQAKWNRILMYSRTVQEAADQAAAIAEGRLTDPDLPSEHSEGSQPTMDEATVRQILETRATNVASAATDQISKVVAKMQGRLDDVQADNDRLRQQNQMLHTTAQALLDRMEKALASKPARGKPGPKPKVKPTPTPEAPAQAP